MMQKFIIYITKYIREVIAYWIKSGLNNFCALVLRQLKGINNKTVNLLHPKQLPSYTEISNVIIDSIETAAGTSNSDPSDGDQAELSALEALGINKQIPAMGGIGLLALGLSMLGLGAVRLRKK